VPFTPAHAVVALPFVRSPLPTAAIAVGAMTPDVPLFFRVGIPYALTHDWLGVVVADLPLALALLLVWRMILRPATPQLAPRWFADRCPPTWTDPASGWRETWGERGDGVPARARRAGVLVLGLLIGISSHLVWDAFTHEGRWGSDVLPVLTGELVGQPLVSWAQHLSSVVGLAAIAAALAVALRRATPSPPSVVASMWVRVVAAAALPASLAAAAALVAVVAGSPATTGWAVYVGRVGTIGAGGFLAILGVIALLVTVNTVRHARDAARFAPPPTDT
jgi:hypothetical protein